MSKGLHEAVALLPYQWKEEKRMFLSMVEEVPSWGKGRFPNTITGSIGSDEMPRRAAMRALTEWSGYDVPAVSFTHLGEVHPYRDSDVRYHLYTCNLGGLTINGGLAMCEWFKEVDLLEVTLDPLVAHIRVQMGLRGVGKYRE